MKKLLILTTFLSSLIVSSVANAKWTKISTMFGNTFYVNLEKIKKHEGKVYYWSLVDLLKPLAGTFSWKTYHEAECGRFEYRDLLITYHKSGMGKGPESHSEDTPASTMRSPPPNSPAGKTIKAVCNHKP